MGSYRIEGGHPIMGEIDVRGSKNGVLPILAATVLTGAVTVLHNCPLISDFYMTLEILKSLGCLVEQQGRTVVIDSSSVTKNQVEMDIVKKMRSSIIFMGALTGRFRETKLGYPGGCEIGVRPIDLHFKAFRKMGVVIEDDKEYFVCRAEKLMGKKINLDFPSVGATENVMLLATLAKGRTIIYNAACEPEIVELQNFLNRCGAKITGAGTYCITIEGVTNLHGTEYTVFPDRIEAGTYLCAAAITGGEITLKAADPSSMRQVLLRLAEMGCEIRESPREIYLKAPKVLHPVERIHTGPYPGFPTDMQPQFMSVLTLAKGTSIISETVFEARFKHIEDLCRMGADIAMEGQLAVIKGVDFLTGGYVFGKDLRGGAALILAGLAAKGETVVGNSCYVERGYESIDQALRSLGAKIRLEKE